MGPDFDISKVIKDNNLTFEDFKRNRSKYFFDINDHLFASAEEAQWAGKNMMTAKGIIYEVGLHRTRKPEEAQRLTKEMGWTDLDYMPELLPEGGGKLNVLVRIIPKAKRVARDASR